MSLVLISAISASFGGTITAAAAVFDFFGRMMLFFEIARTRRPLMSMNSLLSGPRACATAAAAAATDLCTLRSIGPFFGTIGVSRGPGFAAAASFAAAAFPAALPIGFTATSTADLAGGPFAVAPFAGTAFVGAGLAAGAITTAAFEAGVAFEAGAAFAAGFAGGATVFAATGFAVGFAATFAATFATGFAAGFTAGFATGFAAGFTVFFGVPVFASAPL